jgi:transposase
VRKPRVIPDEDHEVVYERVAAVDVAKASGVVCMRLPDPARPGRYSNQIWDNVPAARARITELGRELLRHQVQMVTLESTSDYWRIWYYVLESIGLAVQLVSASQARNLKGRPKTDLLTELADRSFGWCVRSPAMLARFRPRDQRRGYAAGVVRAGGAAARLA